MTYSTNIMTYCPHFKELMNNFIDSNGTWKIQITLKLMFISSKDTVEERDRHLNTQNNLVLQGRCYLFESIDDFALAEYQINSFEKMKGSDSIFDNVNKAYYSY